jgi:hypothetical protein
MICPSTLIKEMKFFFINTILILIFVVLQDVGVNLKLLSVVAC